MNVYVKQGVIIFGVLVVGFFWNSPQPVYAVSQNSIVYIQVTKDERDFQSPWQNQSPSVESHLGVIIEGGDVLTTSFAITDAQAIEVQSFGENRKHSFKVVLNDPEVNLALIRPEEESVIRDFLTRPRLSLGEELPVPSDVSVFYARNHDRLLQVRARLVEVNQATLFTTYSVPIYSLELSRGLRLGWSEPVIAQGKLVGLTMGISQENLRVLPVSIIELFLKRDQLAEYSGFVGLGLRAHLLIDPVARKRLGVEFIDHGVVVSQVFPTSPLYEVVAPEDVIVAIGAHRINATGSFAHPNWGNHPIAYLSNLAEVGSKLSILFYRDGELRQESFTMVRHDSTHIPVPSYHPPDEKPYLLVGGLVMQELSLSFLRSFGNNWQHRAPMSLLYSWFYQNDPIDELSHRVVFLNRVLADDVNRGYHGLRYLVLDSVDGVPIKNLNQLLEVLVESADGDSGEFLKFSFRYGQGEVILSRSEVIMATQRIQQAYRLPSSARMWPQDKP